METSVREDLAVIRRLMEEGREAVDAGGPHFVTWGLLLTAAFVGGWLHETGRVAVHPLWIWGTTVGAGWIASTVIGIRTERRQAVRTTGGRILAGIWVGAGVVLTLAGFLGIGAGALGGDAMLGLTAGMIGSSLFASSFVLGSTPFRLLAGAWWVGAVVLFLWTTPGAQLLLAGMTAGLMLVPGLWLVRSGRQGRAGAGAVRGAEG